MLCSKTVTAKKIEANRMNAQRSTGPRTDRGKLASRFNAVTLGLFAKHVVIFVCDGYGSEKQFGKLLEALREDFQPDATFEEWLVLKIAEGMWRLRRATRSENGSVRNCAISDDRPPEKDDLTEAMDREVDLLTIAEEQIQATGTLSEEIYEKVLPLVVGQAFPWPSPRLPSNRQRDTGHQASRGQPNHQDSDHRFQASHQSPRPSEDYVAIRYVNGQPQRSKKPQQIRGLNQNHNHEMKEIFKSTATSATRCAGPFHDFYAGLLAKRMKPEMARLTLARKIAAIVKLQNSVGGGIDVCLVGAARNVCGADNQRLIAASVRDPDPDFCTTSARVHNQPQGLISERLNSTGQRWLRSCRPRSNPSLIVWIAFGARGVRRICQSETRKRGDQK